MLREFKKFIMRGSVIDMADGMIIGAAFVFSLFFGLDKYFLSLRLFITGVLFTR